MKIKSLVAEINGWLQPHKYRDYCPNGLQVQAHDAPVKKVISAVTASLETIEAAARAGADTLLVHHGYFWKNEPSEITGLKAKRIKALLDNNINLIAYHLPLDFHEELGNNVQLGHLLGLEVTGVLGERRSPLGAVGVWALPEEDRLASSFVHQVQSRLSRDVIFVGDSDREIQTVAWCTGGGQHFFSQAIDEGVDLYLTGEISEPQAHMAKESGVCFIAAGHHATERYGVQALGQKLADTFEVDHQFIDIDNPA